MNINSPTWRCYDSVSFWNQDLNRYHRQQDNLILESRQVQESKNLYTCYDSMFFWNRMWNHKSVKNGENHDS